MGYISNGAYESVVRQPRFIGLDQSGDGFSADPRYAVECENAQTRGGYLRPMAACERLEWTLPSPIQTLKLLHRRWYAAQENERDIFIAATGGKLYWAYPDHGGWHQLGMPADWSGAGYGSDNWSTVTYEVNPTAESDPVDVLLLSNRTDGMICIRGDTMAVSVVATPKKFGVIARFNDRIFGGDIPDDPDMLCYSAPYDPYNWSANEEDPAQGGGSVQQPSWDGDSFNALVPYGDYLLCVKKYRIWRLAGSDPTEYTFYEQYGGGTLYPETIAVSYQLGVLMLGADGVMRYNGETTDYYMKDVCRDIFYGVNPIYKTESCACIFRGRYYLALPMYRPATAYNNAVLIFDPAEGSWLLRKDVSVEAFLATDTKLYFTSHETPGKVNLLHEDGWESDERQAVPMKWIGPWMDLGYKNKLKSAFSVYMTVECFEPVTLSVSLETEKKKKTKLVTFQPAAPGGSCKQRRIGFGGNGRRVRFILESDTSRRWRLTGGVQLEAETTAD